MCVVWAPLLGRLVYELEEAEINGGVEDDESMCIFRSYLVELCSHYVGFHSLL